jgi:hypothetical protein
MVRGSVINLAGLSPAFYALKIIFFFIMFLFEQFWINFCPSPPVDWTEMGEKRRAHVFPTPSASLHLKHHAQVAASVCNFYKVLLKTSVGKGHKCASLILSITNYFFKKV